MTVVLVVVAAAGAAVLRHLLATGVRDSRVGVLVANVVGSFVLGLLAGGVAEGQALVVLGTGFCGTLTTWSAFAHGVATDLRDGRRGEAAVHLTVSLALGLAAAAVGLRLG